ncbi:ankyrin repeat-containing domain, PGG domain protein [Tanacetum coccineum]
MAEINMNEPVMQSAGPTDHEQNEQEINAVVTPRRRPNLANMDLLKKGSRKEYLKIGVPLYEAAITCNWKAAEDILEKYNHLELVRYCITENGETALHIAASAKVPGKVKEFVENLVKKMTKEDLELENINYNTALYLAAGAGNINTVKIMLEKNEKLLSIRGGGSMEKPPKLMPIYTAALFGNHNVVKYMYEKSNALIDDPWTPETQGWLLQKCVENNMFDVALKIVTKHPKLETGCVLGVLAQKPEAFRETESNFIQRTISWGTNLYSKMSVTHQLSQNGNGSVTRVLDQEQPSQNGNGNVSGNLVQEAERKCSTIGRTIKAGKHLYSSSSRIIGETITSGKHRCSSSVIGRVIKSVVAHIVSKVVPPEKNDEALQLLKLIWNAIAEKPKNEIDDILRGAAEFKPTTGNVDQAKQLPSKVGNTRFVIELIRQYPDLIWKVDDKNRSIFHIAIKRRHEGIYNLLYEIGSMKDLITPIKDVHGNTMLHLVGKSASRKRRHQDVSGVAFQMQRELLWFKEVEAMIPHSYRDRKNKDNRTPYELFTTEHKELVKQGERWMKETASQCMVVATLIATIVFAAAFTVPGGYGQNSGHPIFQSKATFIVFVVADAISLFSSTTSILIFLSILTSRYAERDFLVSLPKKLMAGLATLFLSITTMTVAFSVSFFVLYHKGVIWMPILIGVFAVMPVLLYIRLQYALFFDVIRSTYGSRYLFKPRKHVLYYENPKV